ncbi:MAG: hypothetical protein QNJ54_12205 [Prochloraceae cyanobacterium]|nr:hypothetical protein [Prochloraceae cyanobacterium]
MLAGEETPKSDEENRLDSSSSVSIARELFFLIDWSGKVSQSLTGLMGKA